MSKFTLLDAATAVGVGPTLYFTDNPDGIAFQVSDTGAATQITITIETTNDDVNWDTLSTNDITAAGNIFQYAGNPGAAIRANLTVLTAGTAPTVTLISIS